MHRYSKINIADKLTQDKAILTAYIINITSKFFKEKNIPVNIINLKINNKIIKIKTNNKTSNELLYFYQEELIKHINTKLKLIGLKISYEKLLFG